MKIDVKKYLDQLTKLANQAKKYLGFMFVLVLLGLCGFLVFRINQFSHSEPSQDAIDEKLNASQRPKFDQATLDKIQQLQDQNVQVQTLFQQARDNPFAE